MKTVVYILFGIFCAVSANVLVHIVASYSQQGGTYLGLLIYPLYGAGFVFSISGLVSFLQQSRKDDAEKNSRQ